MNLALFVNDIVEHEDGSATVSFDLSDEARKALMQYAILDILKRAVAASQESQEPVTLKE